MRAKAFLEGRGRQYRAGAELECSEEEAARLESIGAAELMAGPIEASEVDLEDGPGDQTEPVLDLPAYDDVTRTEILDMLGQKIQIDGGLKRASKKALYQKLIEVGA